MSQPPTSSPRANSCGIVGQFEIALSSWRMRGSGRTSTAAYGAPSASSAATVRAEKPHIGCSGEPFMKRMISCSLIACADRLADGVLGLGAHGVSVLMDRAWIGPPISPGSKMS